MATGRKGVNIGLAMAIGVVAGVIIGAITGRYGLWIPMGAAVGFAAGLLFPAAGASRPPGP
jgi:hypothetical protein